MPQRRVLLLDNSRLTAYRMQGGEALNEGSFAPDAKGLATFGDYLQAHRRSLFLVLAEVAEESFQTEDIPHSSGKDRRAIVGRKLAQHFYGTPYALAQSQGRLKTGRRDERLLLMALTQPLHLEPWRKVLQQREAIVTGIYSLPQILQNLLPPAQTVGRWLLLTLTHAGLRQSFFDGAQLRFSRLTPLINAGAETVAIAAAGEAARMHHYLASQRLIDHDKPLTTRVLAHPAETAALRAHCLGNASLDFQIVDLIEAARRLGLRAAPASSRADELFCHLLVKKTPSTHFAPADGNGYYRLWQTRFGLRVTAGLAFASAALFAVHQGYDALQLRERAETARLQAHLNQVHYAARMEHLPKIPISAGDLRSLIERYENLALRTQGPAPLLGYLSRSLDAFPALTIDRIEWSIAERIDTAPRGSGTVQGAAFPARGPYAQASVSARLPIGMAGDQRGQLALVADFIRHLGTAPDVLVAVVQPPVDTQSGKVLKSSDDRIAAEAPRFVFLVVRKL
ncbi:MAG: hypothetical protein KGZ43_02145 [Sulfuritalea sp.]|nr:hypothetical protein [Sulfuritalea sp.]